MVKKNKFVKALSVTIIFLIMMSGCIQKQIKPTTQAHTSPTTQIVINEEPKEEVKSENPAPESNNLETVTHMNGFPKFGFIFSGGGAKTWAHIGFLKELQKLKWPVHSVAGFEWGSVVAAEFAMNLSANEVEWEMSKFKSVDQSADFIKSAFAKKATSSMKVSFVCPSLNIPKQTAYLLNRGNLEQLIPYCLAAPGVMKPIYQSVALLNDVPGLAQHMRAAGANKIVLVNVLSTNSKKNYVRDSNSSDNFLWIESAALMSKKPVGVDEVININLDEFGINDFDKRREIIVKGANLSYSQLKRLASKYGL